jgi:peroxiredoxin (alkyl hydroperoxide reductase subunit C)
MQDDTPIEPSGQPVPPVLPLIGTPAPAFAARTTMGERALADYRGRWLVLFAHPADFTPVCTSELIALARAHDRFLAMDCDLLALSIDSLYSHLAWLESMRDRFGVTVPFPLVEDPSMVIGRAYGMLAADAPSSATVRGTFVIDPVGIIRATTVYPLSVGRNIDELLRLVTALRHGDAAGLQTPADWQPGEPALAPTPLTMDEVAAARAARDGEVVDWYYRRIESAAARGDTELRVPATGPRK